uniref:Col_cuticle_N domain-containing protein n=1 Tax=Heterorhabditis bacteriophora TaxID=37862 RepID=A0A1I7X5H5_HETBA
MAQDNMFQAIMTRQQVALERLSSRSPATRGVSKEAAWSITVIAAFCAVIITIMRFKNNDILYTSSLNQHILMPSALAMTPLSYAQVRDTLQSDVGIPSDEYDTDTGPIIGERGNRPYLSINILDLFIDLRLRVGQLIFCIGTAVILLVITSVLILLLLIGFGRVLRDISTQEENIKQGLQMIPNMPSRNHKIVYTTTGGKQDIDQYVEEIDNYLKSNPNSVIYKKDSSKTHNQL